MSGLGQLAGKRIAEVGVGYTSKTPRQFFCCPKGMDTRAEDAIEVPVDKKNIFISKNGFKCGVRTKDIPNISFKKVYGKPWDCYVSGSQLVGDFLLAAIEKELKAGQKHEGEVDLGIIFPGTMELIKDDEGLR